MNRCSHEIEAVWVERIYRTLSATDVSILITSCADHREVRTHLTISSHYVEPITGSYMTILSSPTI